VRTAWPWIALALLGAYHGLNPGMGWLFAVGLGLQEGSRRAVVGALLPIALGHELSVAVVVLALGGLEATAPAAGVRALGAVALIGVGAWKLLRPNRHPRWVGFRVSRPQLARWSFLMSSAHGAGLMLVPVLVGLPVAAADDGPLHGSALLASGGAASALVAGAAAVTVHSLAMLAVMGLVAVVVYEKVGLGILRKGWVNVDMIWAGALVAAGVFTLFT
jgi:hypothetical protein